MHISKKILAVAAGSALALTMASCGGGGGAGSTAGDTITIGIKYDQPGLGQKVGEDYKGLDVDVARYVAKELGFEGDKVIFKETPSAQRETAIQGGQVGLIFATYSITDERKKKVSFAGPYFIAGQDLLVQRRQYRHHRTGRDERQDAVLGYRLDPGGEDQEGVRDYGEAVRAGHLLQVRRGAGWWHCGRGNHRQRDLGRLRGTAAIRRQAQGCR